MIKICSQGLFALAPSPHGRLALPNESPSLNKANLLIYLLTY